MDKYDIRLEFKDNVFCSLELSEDPWLRNEFRICADDENEVRHEVGSMKVYKLNYSEMSRRGVPLWMAFDDLSMETSQCYDVVFTKKGDLRRAFWHEYYGLEEYFARDFHFLDRIEINEEFKGYGIAGKATQIYLENFANGEDAVYFKAFPLQYEGQFHDKPYGRKFDGGFKTAQSKLCSYYESQGFRRIGKTEHFFFVVDDFMSKRVRE